MEQRISLITLGVADVSRARAFYEQLGWRGQEVGETVFFQAGGLGVVLWRQDKLAEDVGAGLVRLDDSFRGMNLAHNVRSRDEVDAVIDAVQAAGAIVIRSPADTVYGGYAGHFTDPHGHAWEIAYNPGFPLGDGGTLTGLDFGNAFASCAAAGASRAGPPSSQSRATRRCGPVALPESSRGRRWPESLGGRVCIDRRNLCYRQFCRSLDRLWLPRMRGVDELQLSAVAVPSTKS